MSKKQFLILLLGLLGFVSCKNEMKHINRINYKILYPSGEAHDLLVKYTDSSKIKAQLKTKVMLDYSTAKYSFNEFPEKVYLTVYNEKKEKTYLESNKAKSYGDTKVIEFIGDVKITFPDGNVMETNHLFFDQKNDWFYTENYFKIKGEDSSFEGIGLDFDSKFNIIDSQQNRGEVKNLKDENI